MPFIAPSFNQSGVQFVEIPGDDVIGIVRSMFDVISAWNPLPFVVMPTRNAIFDDPSVCDMVLVSNETQSEEAFFDNAKPDVDCTATTGASSTSKKVLARDGWVTLNGSKLLMNRASPEELSDLYL